jgi:hypothetical protein
MNLRIKTCVVLLGAWIAIASCGRPPSREFDTTATLSRTMLLGIGNFTVVEIDLNGHSPTLHWEAFNKTHGNAFNVPYEILTISSGDEHYVVTDKTVGNNALSVNGVTKPFNGKTQRLRIRIGQGVEIAEGADYQSATKYYDWPANSSKTR